MIGLLPAISLSRGLQASILLTLRRRMLLPTFWFYTMYSPPKNQLQTKAYSKGMVINAIIKTKRIIFMS
jgi:hypothetical protein